MSEKETMTVTEALAIALEEIGWHGHGEHDRDNFYCEFCKASNADYTQIQHHSGCKVTALRKALSKALGETP